MYPSTFYLLTGTRLHGQQSKQRPPDSPVPCHYLQLFLFIREHKDVLKSSLQWVLGLSWSLHLMSKTLFTGESPHHMPEPHQLAFLWWEAANLLWAQICKRCPLPPLFLPLHFIPTHEQDPKILELPHLRQRLIPYPELVIHPCLTEGNGLRIGGANSQPSCSTLGCKLPVCAGGLGFTRPKGWHQDGIHSWLNWKCLHFGCP